MYRVLFLLFVLISLKNVYADDFKLPVNSVWTLNELGLEGSSTSFSGELRFIGDYDFSWEYLDDELYSFNLHITPKDNYETIFPIFLDDLTPSVLFARNAKEVAKIFLKDANKLGKLLSGKIKSESGTANFKIKNYWSAVDCNQRSYIVDVTSISKL